VQGIGRRARVEGAVANQPIQFCPYAAGAGALVGIDLETRPGRYDWRFAIVDDTAPPRVVSGRVRIRARHFPVERLTLPPAMVDLDAETEQRAEAESARLRTLFRTVTGARLWHGAFTTPIGLHGGGTGFGARRLINGQPRSPHGGADYAAERGTPVVAANAGRVALIGDFFFPGQLVVIDHGLGLYTAYFHLDRVTVTEQETVDRGQPIGTVGATGRATGPHLHFAVTIGSARIDPAMLLALHPRD
jgi:murein DD-endopeptidase MepM/ murein hydrolase activator NlpD